MWPVDYPSAPFRQVNMLDKEHFVADKAIDSRCSQFSWEKARPSVSDPLTGVLCYEQAVLLHEVLQEKNKEIALLRKQLTKLNEINYILTKDLDRLTRQHSGKKSKLTRKQRSS